MELLSDVLSDAKGYWCVMDGLEKDDDLTAHQKWTIQIRCQYLYCSLYYAKEMMPISQNWDRCCQEAVKHLLLCGIKAGCSRSVRNWYLEFTRKNRKFEMRIAQKHKLPMFLDLNRDEKEKIQQYAKEHLHELSIELMSEYIHNTVIPIMVQERFVVKPEDEQYEATVQGMYREYGLKKICPSTIYKWLKLLGFRYEPRRKGYYVDGHEKPETISYRNKYVQRYLQYERRMYRWIQISAEESEKKVQQGLVPRNSGYRYKNSHGVDMVEYHVDSSKLFQDDADKETRFGGHLSVRIEMDKPLIIFGHDESIFKQYHMTKSAWVAPDGTTVLVPKDDGQGLMISAFQSREFGFGMEICEEDLRKINERRRGQKYVDETAAVSKKGTALKKDLKHSPFVVEFEYGANNEGYWSYEHMVLQLEDCVDCLQVLAPQFDYLFLFDHSCGHDKQREDGLNVENMTKSFGGKQAHLHDTLIKECDGYLGPFPKILRPGDVQSMVFKESDIGPFWLSEQERLHQQYDEIEHGKKVKRKLRKDELVKKLAEAGVTATGNYTTIQRLAVE
jgi:hypothetical protein